MAWVPGKIDDDVVFMGGVACFYCGEEIKKGDTHVYWDGFNDETIGMHPICAIELAGHLEKDGREAIKGE